MGTRITSNSFEPPKPKRKKVKLTSKTNPQTPEAAAKLRAAIMEDEERNKKKGK